MSAIKDGGPAFPLGSVEHIDGVHYAEAGMSLRDYFAAKAMQGLLSNPGGPIQANPQNGWDYTNTPPEGVAGTAYEMADHMLAARKAKP